MAQYPGATASDSNLYIAKNNLSTALNGAINNSVTTITVTSTTGFPTTGYITIELEAISYTGVTGTQFTGCVRGADGTTAASHADAIQVFHNVVADHHNVLKDEMIAVEGDLRNTFSSITPVTAANTATSWLQRTAHIVSQIKALGGLTNWYDTPPSVPNAFTNILINGGMDFWQRATSFAAPAHQTYTADRWAIRRGGGITTVSVSREATIIDSGLYSMKMDVTAVGAGNTVCNMYQFVENAPEYRGKTLTVSVRLRTSTASTHRILIGDSTDETTSAYHNGDGTFQTISVSKLISASTTQLYIYVGSDINGTITGATTLYIDSVMLVVGSAAIPFIPKDYATELAQCMRYFQTETFNINEWHSLWYSSPNDYLYMPIRFKVPMRVNPTMTYTTSALTYYGFPTTAPTPTAQTTPTLTYPGSGTVNFSSGYTAVTHQTTFSTFTLAGSFTADAEL